MTTRPATDSLQALLDTIWAERQVVEFLLFKLTAAKLLLAADERRFIAPALDEVDRVVGALREAELHRSMAVSVVASEWRMSVDDLTLNMLATQAPEPWHDTFAEHERAFGTLAAEIDAATEANRALAAGGLNRIRETMDLITGNQTPSTYDADAGRPCAGAPSASTRRRDPGTGVNLEGISRLRDGFLDARMRTTLGEFARLETRTQLLSRTETLFGEPDNGISGALSRPAQRGASGQLPNDLMDERDKHLDRLDVDIAEAIMNLQIEEVAYQATLQAMARALPPSLASFLR